MENPSSQGDARKLGRAWLWLCLALALHVLDEALTGFLTVYNPSVAAIRTKIPWLPLPVFRFDVWLAGLIFAIIALLVASVWVFRGVRWTRTAAYIFAIFMTVNALGHTAGTIFGQTVDSVRFDGPMPGFYSSPFLLATSIYLLYRLGTSVPEHNQH
jgi:hypothetical protein